MTRKFTLVHATHRDLFGKSADRAQVVKMIQSLPWGAVLNTISQMLTRPVNDRFIQERFVSYFRLRQTPRDVIEHLEGCLESCVLTSPQGLLTVCKWLFAYGDPAKFRGSELDVETTQTIAAYLCVCVADFLEDDDLTAPSLAHRVVQMIAFNESRELAPAIARANYLYSELAQERSLYLDKEYLDFNHDFEQKYGYSVGDYLAVLFAIQADFGIGERTPGYDWVKDVGVMFSRTGVHDCASRLVLDHFRLTLDAARSWARETINAPFDFSLFQQKPFLEVDEGRTFFPIAPRFMEELVFTGLFHRARHCYPPEDDRFLRFFGRPFEEYIKALVMKSAHLSTLPYEIFPEYRYGKGGGKRSSDIMIKLGTRLLVIEAKALRMNMDALVKGDPSAIDRDRHRMVVLPLKQARDTAAQLIPLHTELHQTEAVYLMTVTMGGFPTLEPFESEIRTAVMGGGTDLPIKGLYHLDIEEFEMFCALLERRQPIFRHLDNKTRQASHEGFKNFLHAASLPRRLPATLAEQFDQTYRKMRATLFPGTCVMSRSEP